MIQYNIMEQRKKFLLDDDIYSSDFSLIALCKVLVQPQIKIRNLIKRIEKYYYNIIKILKN